MLKTFYKFRRFYAKHYRWFICPVALALSCMLCYIIITFSIDMVESNKNTIMEINKTGIILGSKKGYVADIKVDKYQVNITLSDDTQNEDVCMLNVKSENTDLDFRFAYYKPDYKGNGIYILKKYTCTLRS